MTNSPEHALTTLMRQTIPMLDFADWRLTSISPTRASAHAPLSPNRNIHGTGFAGAQYVAAVATGWALIQYSTNVADMQGEVVLRDASIRYRRPVKDDMIINAWRDTEVSDREHWYPVCVELISQEAVCAEFRGVYVFLPAS